MSLNKTPDVSASTLWEAYISGEIISYTGFVKKLRKEKLSELTQHIPELDRLYAIHKTSELYKERLCLQAEFDVLTTKRATELLLQTRSQFYEHGDKARKFLARQLHQVSSSHLIPQIHTYSCNTSEPMEINNAFKEFYMFLYSSEQDTTPDFSNCFENLDIPSLDQSAVAELERPITAAELSTAASSLQSGKSPGPDGFPSELKKNVLAQICPSFIGCVR